MEINWEIKQRPIYDIEGNQISGYKEILRQNKDSSIEVLSVMKNSYYPLKVDEFKSLVYKLSAHTDLKLAGYSEFKKGKIITAQLKSDNGFKIGGSTVEGYLTLGTGFDGSRSFFMGHISEYLRCMNQFGRIITNRTTKLTKNSKLKIDEIIADLIYYNTFEKELYTSFEQMQNVKIDAKIVKDCVERLVGLTYEEKLDNSLISHQKGEKLVSLRDSILREVKDLGENAFALFNGVTYYTTHKMKTYEKDVFGNLFTSKNKVNQEGYKFAKELLLV